MNLLSLDLNFFIKLSVTIHSHNEISFLSTTFLITVYLSFVYSFLLTILLVVIIHQSDDMFLIGLSSFKGSTTCIPTICGWNNRHSRIPWIENQYSKANTSRLHSIHNIHVLAHNGKFKFRGLLLHYYFSWAWIYLWTRL